MTDEDGRDQLLVRSEVLERVTDGIVALDADFQFTYLNGRAEEILDSDREALLGTPVWDAFPEIVGTVAEDRIREAMRSQRPAGFERYNEDLDGWFDVRLYPDERGLSISITDSTERTERERALEQENERLDEFADLLTHDLRNPLAVAQGYTTILKDECDTAQAAVFDRVLDALGRIEEIIEDTLTLARHVDTAVDTAPVSLGDLLSRCWGLVNTPGATLLVEGEFTVNGDTPRLQHLFENLFRNAIDHGGAGVTVQVGRFGADGIYVEDDGPGIPAEEREVVFDPGYGSASGGIGLGLTIVRRMAEAHGWTVSITDGREDGARFEFTGVEFVS